MSFYASAATRFHDRGPDLSARKGRVRVAVKFQLRLNLMLLRG